MGRALTTRGAVMVVLAAATVLLSGCAPAAPPAAESPPPSSQPIFASDAEALAAAEAAYAEYLAVSDQIAQEGGANPERIEQVATGQALEDGLADAGRFSDPGYVGLGSSQFRNAKLQSRQQSGTGVRIVLYLCLDVRGTSIIDAEGKIVSGSPDPGLFSLEVSLQSVSSDQTKVESSTVWTGDDLCD